MTDMSFRDLLDALEDAGLWSAMPETEKRALIQTLEAGEEATWTVGGAWRADGEDLADGEVEAWLSRMAGVLAECAVELQVATVSGPFEPGSTGYTVSVNGTTIALYSFVPNEPGLPASEDPWMDCTVEPVAEVNHLLAEAGSSHRVAVFWPGGNDGFSVLGERAALQRACEQGLAAGSWGGVIP
jgi:hypothetical protein